MTIEALVRATADVVGAPAAPVLAAAASVGGPILRVVVSPPAASVAVEVAWPAAGADAGLRGVVDGVGSRIQRATFDAWRNRPGTRVARLESSARRRALAVELEVDGESALSDDLARIEVASLVKPALRAHARTACDVAGIGTVVRAIDRAALGSEWSLAGRVAGRALIPRVRALAAHLAVSPGLVDALAAAHAAAGAGDAELGVVLSFDAVLPLVSIQLRGLAPAVGAAALAAAGLGAWTAGLVGVGAAWDLVLRLTDEDRFQGSIGVSGTWPPRVGGRHTPGAGNSDPAGRVP